MAPRHPTKSAGDGLLKRNRPANQDCCVSDFDHRSNRSPVSKIRSHPIRRRHRTTFTSEEYHEIVGDKGQVTHIDAFIRTFHGRSLAIRRSSTRASEVSCRYKTVTSVSGCQSS
ncbi:hypothetical protein LSAT2_019967 [Lamellibrachia satsuma]|nr:hypothetical protein LSAT2_019967 [Lamellibrachia satsuma]